MDVSEGRFMLKFLNRQKKGTTFKKKVDQFWHWFEDNQQQIRKALLANKPTSVSEDTLKNIDKIMPGLSWCYGPGQEEDSFTFTLSPEANRSFQFLTAFWYDSAPAIPGWTFYAARQPARDPSKFTISIGEKSYSIAEIWLVLVINEEDQKIDISAWHPHFSELDDNTRYQVLFLWLDEVLGENGTEQWIGQVDFSTEKFAEAIPLLEMKEHLDSITQQYGWEKPSPENCYSFYEISSELGDFPRSDTLRGNTCHMQLVNEFMEFVGDLPDLLSGSHADFVYVQFPASFLNTGEEIQLRDLIEQKINKALNDDESGHSIGSSSGTEYVYLDFIIFDGQQSIEAMLEGMKECQLPEGSSINYWAAEKKEVFKI